MQTMARERLDNFNGSKDEYIIYLEECLKELRHNLAQSSQQQQKPELPAEDQESVHKQPWHNLQRRLTACVPATQEQWDMSRRELNLDTEAGFAGAVAILTQWTRQARFDGKPAGPLEIVRSYRDFLLKESRNWPQQLFNFGILLYTCTCIVAIKNGARLGDVDADMRQFLGLIQGSCGNSTSYFRQIRAGAKWAIRWIAKLDSAGLGYRAWEVLIHSTFCHRHTGLLSTKTKLR